MIFKRSDSCWLRGYLESSQLNLRTNFSGSTIVMEKFTITQILRFDHHLLQIGFWLNVEIGLLDPLHQAFNLTLNLLDALVVQHHVIEISEFEPG